MNSKIPPTKRVSPVGSKCSIRREHSFEPMRVEGELPSDLHGTLFRNGPGLYELFDRPYEHMFEGDGAVSAVRLEGGKAYGAVRVVQSEGLKEERERGKVLYGFTAPWWRRFYNMNWGKSKNTANTHVVAWQDRLFALMEAAKPTELSFDDLSTIGETDLGGIIPEAFSAHPHEVPGRKALYNFGLRYGKESCIDLFELPYVGKARHLGSVPLRAPVMMHDCMVTETHFVFFVAPVKVNILRAILALGPFQKLFDWKPQDGTEIITVSIDRPEEIKRFTVDAFYQWHFSNGFARNGELIVDFVRYPNLGSLGGLKSEMENKQLDPEQSGIISRAVIDPSSGSFSCEPLWDRGCEFPRIHPDKQGREYRYVWLNSLSPERGVNGEGGDQIACLDLETGKAEVCQLPEGMVASEPVFVPKAHAKDERDGYALAYLYEAASHTSCMGVFDSDSFVDGPVAKVWFDHHIPTTFHGSWVPAKG
jgi:all-trans-8'-apo-beta-carotenal 15,15'-oxygenase